MNIQPSLISIPNNQSQVSDSSEPIKPSVNLLNVLTQTFEGQNKHAGDAVTVKATIPSGDATASVQIASTNAVANQAFNKEAASFPLECNPRFKDGKPIIVQIARIPDDLALCEDDLYEIFALINEHTINQPYPCAPDDYEKYDDETRIWRPNHNGTHSARQVRLLEAVMDLMETNGSKEVRELWHNVSEEEIINLKLAAYLYRAGRVDETNFRHSKPDDYQTRSALIYEAYAKELQVSPEVVAWTKLLLVNSGKPIGARSEVDIDRIPKNLLCHNILWAMHELDIMRCSTDYDKILAHIREIIFSLIENRYETVSFTIQLLNFAEKLCHSTGSEIVYELFEDEGNLDLFHDCSVDGAYCWKILKDWALPSWNFKSLHKDAILKTNSEMTDFLDIQQFEDDPNGLLPTESLALYVYTLSTSDHTYKTMNRIIQIYTKRNQKTYLSDLFFDNERSLPSEYCLAWHAEFALKTTLFAIDALKKLPATNFPLLYRSVYLTANEAAIYKPGSIVTENRFLSTSLDLDMAWKTCSKRSKGEKVLFIFHNSFSGKDIAQYADCNEREVLFPPSKKFRVKQIFVFKKGDKPTEDSIVPENYTQIDLVEEDEKKDQATAAA